MIILFGLIFLVLSNSMDYPLDTGQKSKIRSPVEDFVNYMVDNLFSPFQVDHTVFQPYGTNLVTPPFIKCAKNRYALLISCFVLLSLHWRCTCPLRGNILCRVISKRSTTLPSPYNSIFTKTLSTNKKKVIGLSVR